MSAEPITPPLVPIKLEPKLPAALILEVYLLVNAPMSVLYFEALALTSAEYLCAAALISATAVLAAKLLSAA